MGLPNFDYEQINDWICSDRFRFEKEDVAGEEEISGLTFYKLVYPESIGCITEKIVVFEGDIRVGYVTWGDSELYGIYVMPSYRNRGIAKKMLSYVPQGLHVCVQEFKLRRFEPAGLDYVKLNQFYTKHYSGKEVANGNHR